MTDRKTMPDEPEWLLHMLDALDDEPIDPADVARAVERFGAEIPALARDIRARITRHDAAERRARFAQAASEHEDRLSVMEAEEDPVMLEGPALGAMLQALVARAGPAAGAHFQKFERATDEEKRELIRSLQALLAERDDDATG